MDTIQLRNCGHFKKKTQKDFIRSVTAFKKFEKEKVCFQQHFLDFLGSIIFIVYVF